MRPRRNWLRVSTTTSAAARSAALPRPAHQPADHGTATTAHTTGPPRPRPRPAPARPGRGARRGPRQPGTPSQRRLAVLYNQQGLRPDEIASKLGLTRYEVTQIILAARTQGKL